MAKNQVACGNVLDLSTTVNIKSGDAVLVGDLLGVAAIDGVPGDVVSIMVSGVFTLPKRTNATTAVINQGAKVYWDATNKVIDNTDNAAANKHIGWAYNPAASTYGFVNVKLIG